MCFPPRFFARLVGASPEQLSQIENDQLIPSDDVLERISIITKTTRGWYLRGTQAPTVNNWGYFELPWPGIESLGEAKTRAIADIEECLREDFPETTRDTGPPPHYLANIQGQPWRFVVIPLGSNGCVIFKVGDILWPAMQHGLTSGGSVPAKITEVTEDFASKIGSPRQRHTDPEKVIELFQMLGLDTLSDRWRLDISTIADRVWKADRTEYRELVAGIARLLLQSSLPQLESPPELPTYTRDELERLRPLAWKDELGLD